VNRRSQVLAYARRRAAEDRVVDAAFMLVEKQDSQDRMIRLVEACRNLHAFRETKE
jgi:hypothetical protein